MNPDKTGGGQYVNGYACEPATAAEEFLLAKKEYIYLTGRTQEKRNVLIYHIRQSFKPGETDAETANDIGRELAMSFTKGKHAFVVATHIDKAHIHNHIIFNSTTLNCERKFEEMKCSGRVIRRISDLLCAKNGLSIIEDTEQSKSQNYAKWLGGKPPTWRDKLRRKIDEVLPDCATFDDFTKTMKDVGYIVNDRRKHITFLAPEQKTPTRLDTLRGNYTEAAIRERLTVTKNIPAGGADNVLTRVNLLIDIQTKIREGKGEGYEQWARVFNLKEAAKTLLFLKENGITNYEDLVEKASSSSGEFSSLSEKNKEAEKRMKEITELQKHIGTYGKTRDVYAQYKASGWNKKFYEEHSDDIKQHRATKKHFDELGIKKMPKISELKQEYATLQNEKKKCYADYRKAKENMRQMLTAKGNVERILGINQEAITHDEERVLTRGNSLER